MSKKFVDLTKVRAALAGLAEQVARDSGIENPRVTVRIEEPNARGHRHIEIQVEDATDIDPRRYTKFWQDN